MRHRTGVRNRKITGTGGKDKTIVVGSRERSGRIIATVSETRKRKPLHTFIKDNVEPGSALYTDALKSYEGLGGFYKHEFIDHAEMYVFGDVHSNGMENFWLPLKRSIKGPTRRWTRSISSGTSMSTRSGLRPTAGCR